jgi:hypothetical protein
MILLSGGIDFENRITTGQVIEIAAIIGSVATFIMRKYVRAEEDSSSLQKHEKQILDMHEVQTRLAGVQSSQQMLIEQMDKRLTRVETWRDRI